MASENSLKKKNKDQFMEMAKSMKWGLSACSVLDNCGFCRQYSDYPNTVYQFRNFYTSGMPVEIIGILIDPGYTLDLSQLQMHAARHNWVTKRGKLRGQVVTEESVQFLIMRRIAQSMNVVSGASADKMIQLLAQTHNMTKQPVETTINNSFSWETVINNTGKNGKETVITLEEDENFLPEPLLLEGEVSEASE